MIAYAISIRYGIYSIDILLDCCFFSIHTRIVIGFML